MRQILLISQVIALSFQLTSCSEDTIQKFSKITTKDYEFTDYNFLEVNDNFKVYITFSDTIEKLQVEANENLHNYIKLIQEDNKLIIKQDNVHEITGNETLNIYITTKPIINFTLKGNSKLVIENVLNIHELIVNLTDNSSFTGPIDSELFRIISEGNCMAEISGSVNFLDAKLTGTCMLSDYNLKIKYLKMNFSGNNNAFLTVTDAISIDARGNSILSFKGSASIIHKDLSACSKIIKKG